MKLMPPTPEEVDRALALLKPARSLMTPEHLANLDDELKAELHDRLCRTVFPVEWASRLQWILLLLHDAHRVDPPPAVDDEQSLRVRPRSFCSLTEPSHHQADGCPA